MIVAWTINRLSEQDVLDDLHDGVYTHETRVDAEKEASHWSSPRPKIFKITIEEDPQK